MSRQDFDAVLKSADPIARGRVDGLALGEAEEAMLAGIMAEAQEVPARTAAGRRGPVPARRLFGRLSLAFAAVVAVAAAFLVVLGSGGRPGEAPEEAVAAQLAQLAKISPHVVIDAPGWQVVGAQEADATEGSTNFSLGSLEESTTTDIAEFQWRSVSLQTRAAQMDSYGDKMVGIAPVLGTSAEMYLSTNSIPGLLEVTGLWEQEGRAFELRSYVPDLATFRSRLAALRMVSLAAWIRSVSGGRVTGGRAVAAFKIYRIESNGSKGSRVIKVELKPAQKPAPH